MLEQPLPGLGPKVSGKQVLVHVLQDIFPNLLWYQELEVCSSAIFPMKRLVEHTFPQDKVVPIVPGLGTLGADWWSLWSVSTAYPLMQGGNMHVFLLKLLQLSGGVPRSPVLLRLRPHPPLCDQCEGDHELTLKHILIECNFLKIIRQRHYDVTDLNQLFKIVSSKRILDFVKDIGLYNSL